MKFGKKMLAVGLVWVLAAQSVIAAEQELLSEKSELLSEKQELLSEKPELSIAEEEGGTEVQYTDTNPPHIELHAEADFSKWYHTAVELTFTVEDVLPESAEEKTNMAAADVYTQESDYGVQEYISGVASLQCLLNGELILEENEPEEAVVERTVRITEDQVEGEASLTIRAEDHAGNKAVKEVVLYMDGNAPILIGTGMAEEISGENYEGELLILEKNPDLNTLDVELGHASLLGEYTEDLPGEPVVDKDAGTISIPLFLEQEGHYDLKMEISDLAANRGTLEETFTLDLEPPVITGFSELGGKYYDSFHIPLSVEEMSVDLSEVTAQFWLDGRPFSIDKSVSSPGLHILKAVFTDAFAHETTEVIRFVVRARESVLQRADRHMGYSGVDEERMLLEITEENESEKSARDIRTVQETGQAVKDAFVRQNERLQELMSESGREILQVMLWIFVVLGILIVLVSVYEKKQ